MGFEPIIACLRNRSLKPVWPSDHIQNVEECSIHSYQIIEHSSTKSYVCCVNMSMSTWYSGITFAYHLMSLTLMLCNHHSLYHELHSEFSSFSHFNTLFTIRCLLDSVILKGNLLPCMLCVSIYVSLLTKSVSRAISHIQKLALMFESYLMSSSKIVSDTVVTFPLASSSLWSS